MNYLKISFFIILALYLSGCAGGQRMYYWGDYSNTLYKLKKHPSEESLLSHQQALEKIISESEKNNLRVPPGVYAELGYMYFRQNKKDLAIQNFHREKALYPESALLMDRLENAAKLVDEHKSTADSTGKAMPDKPATPDNLDKSEKSDTTNKQE
jgi:hypothetical protein